MLRGSLVGSVSLASTLMLTGVSIVVVAVSGFARGVPVGAIINLVIVFPMRFATYTYPSGPWLKETGTAPLLVYKYFTSLRLLRSTTNTLPVLVSVKK